jgi:predicted nucleic acid-binding Zn ribbon protein
MPQNRVHPKLGPPKRDARQRILADWRGLDLAPIERATQAPTKPTAQVMDRVLARLNIDRRRRETEILKVWNLLIDPNIVAHARPTGLRKGTLFISVDNSVWLAEIVRYRQKEILQRLQHSYGRDIITRLSFRIG